MFIPHTTDTGAVLPWEYLPATAGTYKAGQLLNITGGNLTAIVEASVTTPQYLCMADVTAADGDLVPVTRVTHNTIYETTLSAATGAAPGALLEVSAGGLEADGSASGTFEVVYADGIEAGDMVRGRFV